MVCPDEIRDCILSIIIDAPPRATGNEEMGQSIWNILSWTAAGLVSGGDNRASATASNFIASIIGESGTIRDYYADLLNKNPLPQLQNPDLFGGLSEDTLATITELQPLDSTLAKEFSQIAEALASGNLNNAINAYDRLEHIDFDNLSPEQKPLVDRFFLTLSQYYTFDDVVEQFGDGTPIVSDLINRLPSEQRQTLIWQLLSLAPEAQAAYFDNLSIVQTTIGQNQLSSELFDQIATNPAFLEAVVQFGGGSSTVLTAFDNLSSQERQSFMWQVLTLMTPEMRTAYGENLIDLQEGLGELPPDVVTNLGLINSLATSQDVMMDFEADLAALDIGDLVNDEERHTEVYALNERLTSLTNRLRNQDDWNEKDIHQYILGSWEIPWDEIDPEKHAELQTLIDEYQLVTERFNEITHVSQGSPEWDQWLQSQAQIPPEARLYLAAEENPELLSELANTQLLTPLVTELLNSDAITGLLAEQLFATTGGLEEGSTIFDQAVQGAVTRLMYDFVPGSDVMVQDEEGRISRIEEGFNPIEQLQADIASLKEQVANMDAKIAAAKESAIQGAVILAQHAVNTAIANLPKSNCSCGEELTAGDEAVTPEGLAGMPPPINPNGAG